MAGPVTRPPRAGLLVLIGYVLTTSIGLAAVGAAYGVIRAAQGEPAYLVAALALALTGWVLAALNREVVAWWVRRQPADDPLARR